MKGADGRLRRFVSNLYQTVSVILWDEADIWLVDPAYFPDELARLQRRIHRWSGTARLLFTHSDYDHIIGAYAFADLITVASRDWDQANEERGLAEAERFDHQHYVMRPPSAWRPPRRDVSVGDGETLGSMIFYRAPGHTADGLLAYHQPSGTLLVGDYLSSLEFPFVQHDFADYARTLLRISTLLGSEPIRLVVPGHGPAHEPLAAIRQLRRSATYLDQLLQAARDQAVQRLPRDLRPQVVAARAASAFALYDMPPYFWPQHLANAEAALSFVDRAEPAALESWVADMAALTLA